MHRALRGLHLARGKEHRCRDPKALRVSRLREVLSSSHFVQAGDTINRDA